MLTRRSVAASPAVDPVIDELLDRLRSLDGNCLTNLGRGLDAMTHGDLTIAVRPVTEFIGSRARSPEVQSALPR